MIDYFKNKIPYFQFTLSLFSLIIILEIWVFGVMCYSCYELFVRVIYLGKFTQKMSIPWTIWANKIKYFMFYIHE